jgi:hypothetical protein
LQLQRRFYQTAPIWSLHQIVHNYPISLLLKLQSQLSDVSQFEICDENSFVLTLSLAYLQVLSLVAVSSRYATRTTLFLTLSLLASSYPWCLWILTIGIGRTKKNHSTKTKYDSYKPFQNKTVLFIFKNYRAQRLR